MQISTDAELSAVAHNLVGDAVATAVVIAGAVRTTMGWVRVAASAGRLYLPGDAPRAGESTFFDLASVTKPVTALTVARLVRAGELGYDERLVALLPELRGALAASCTLEHLLAHRAGLEGHRPLYAPVARGIPMDREAAVLEAANARRTDCLGDPPDQGFPPLYSDLGYLLLGEAIARRTRTPLEQVVLDRVLAPLQLEVDMGTAGQLRARYEDFEQCTAATEVVAWRGGAVRGRVHDENAWAMSGMGMSGHAGLFGRATAVLRLGEAVLEVLADERSGFLTARELEPLVMPRPGGTLRAGFDGKSTEGSSTGRHWGARSIGHLGFTGTSLWVDPDAMLAGVLLTNRVHPTRESHGIRKARPAVYDALARWAAAANTSDRGGRIQPK